MTRASVGEAMAEDVIAGSRVRADTKHGPLTVDQIGEALPGGARLMDELGRRYWSLYYAAKAGNWDLAGYMEKESEKLLGIMAQVRPKYAADLATFLRDEFAPIARAIDARDWPAFEAAYRRGIEASDVYHNKYNKGFLRFRLPDHPPDWLDVAPR